MSSFQELSLKIYTKTGDAGTTGLQGGQRVSKSNIRIISYGVVDEINSVIGLILTHQLDEDIRKLLIKIQNELFVVGSDLSNIDMDNTLNRINLDMVTFLEKQIDNFENGLEPISNFILPGGTKIASLIHFARTITRRAETQLVLLAENEKINEECKKYMNRLSDLFFVLARVVNKRSQTPDIIWKPTKDTL